MSEYLRRNDYYKQQLLKLLSLEYNCDPDAFAGEDNILTESKLCDGRRMYGNKKYFFHMVTLGSNAVITAEPCLHSFLQEYIKDKTGHWLFEVPNLLEIEKELNKFSYTLTQSHHMFLPSQKVDTQLNCSGITARISTGFTEIADSPTQSAKNTYHNARTE